MSIFQPIEKFKYAAIAVLMLTCSCGPSTYTLNLEISEPTESGLKLMGKSIAVAYVPPTQDSCLTRAMADGFAYKMETEYFDGCEAVDLFELPRMDSATYSSKDTLVSLVMETGADVVFLIHPEFPELGENTMQFKLYVYDSMDSLDQVRDFTGKAGFIKTEPYCFQLGSRATSHFLPVWKRQQFTFYYFDESASIAVAEKLITTNDWAEAMKGWLGMLNTKNLRKRACYEYNIALSCFMLDKKELAAEWLDRADADYSLALSPGLRKRIAGK